MTTPAPTPVPEDSRPAPASRFRLAWLLVLAAGLAVAGMVVWLLLAGGGGEPTVSFDGTAATYSGPETLAGNGVTTLILENTGDKKVAFAWARLKADWTTEEAEFYPESAIMPPWLEDYGVIANVNPGTTIEKDQFFRAATYELYVWDWDISRAYRATWIEAGD